MDTPVTPPKKTNLIRKSNQSTNAKSTNSSPDRNTAKFSNIKEIPLDPKARYTISYVPGMVEHEIDTGKTFEDAKMKIVLLTSELERVNTYNYSLVRENEVLRVQSNKSEREKDLENKLAIVLAENEKLNQVIEEIYDVYMSQKGYGSGSNEEYEKRIAELYHDLEEWKQRYNILEDQNNVVELENTLKELQNERDLLSEQLALKDRDLEVLRARLAPLDRESDNVNELAQDNAALTAENKSLKKEIEAIKLKYGNADNLQLKIAEYENKIKLILGENEKLNVLLTEKGNEVKDLKGSLEVQKANKSNNSGKIQEVTISLAQKEEKVKSSGAQTPKIKELSDENNRLEKEIERLKIQVLKNKETQAQFERVLEENSKLKQEIEKLKSQNLKNKENQAHLAKALEENARLQQEIEKLINQQAKNKEIQAKLTKAQEENKKLFVIVTENERELSLLREAAAKAKENQAALERLTIKISELIKENEKLSANSLKKSSQGDNSPILREKISKLEELLEERQKELEDFYIRFSETHQKSLLADEYKQKLELAVQENERITTLLNDKYDEINTLKAKLSALDTQNIYPKSNNEERVQILLAENQRLTDLIKEKSNEVDNLRYKLIDFQSGTGQVTEFLNKLSLVSTENERLNKDLDSLRNKVNELNNEKFKLELLVSEKDREIESLKLGNSVRVVDTEVWDLRGQNETLKSAGVEQNRKIGELEGRIAQLITLETKVNYYNIQIEQLQKDAVNKENEIQALTLRIIEKDREIEELKRKTSYGDSDLERKIAAIREEKENEIRKLQTEKLIEGDKIRRLEVEVEGSHNLLRNAKLELEEWKRRFMELEDSRGNQEELSNLRKQFENLQAKNIQIRDLQQKFSAERMAYETQILQLEQTIKGLEEENELVVNEKERLANLSVQRLSQIHQLEYRTNEDGHKLEILQLKNQLEQLKSNSYDVKQLAIQHSSERAADQAKINELTLLNFTLKSDIEKLNQIMDQRKADVESLTQQNNDLARICQKLQSERQGGLDGSTAGDIELLKNKVAELELSRNEFKRQAERNSIDLTRKNRELIDKIQEVDILKLKYEEAFANYQALNNELFNKLSIKH